MSQITDAGHVKELARRLKELRSRRRLSQEALANKSGVSAQQIWRIETGQQKTVRALTVERLARALGCAPEILTGQAPLPEPGPTRPVQQSDEDYSINVSVDGAVRNAFTLAAIRYRVPIARIVELAPFLFVLAAEGSLERRRSKLTELRDAFDNSQNLAMGFLHLPSSLLPSGPGAPELDDEEKSISVRDILAERLSGNESIGSVIEPHDDESRYNPFVVYLKEAMRVDDGVASIRSFDRNTIEFDVCYQDALKQAGDNKELAQSIIDGEVMLHKMLRELPNDAAVEARIAWLHEKREQYRAAVAERITVTIDDLL